jgi:hypothetical protein
MKKLILVALTAITMLPAVGLARVFVGVGPRIGYRYGYGYGYGPYWGGPYSVYSAPLTGAVKFDGHDKLATVYVNEAYAGTVGQLKTLHLTPGSYLIQVTEPGRVPFAQKVYVAGGSTVHIPLLQPALPGNYGPAPLGPGGFPAR